ncbi:hypothetical protein GS836_24175 [Rhodococcus hoagii]|nr:hypothetical protein [Prescottella equi]
MSTTVAISRSIQSCAAASGSTASRTSTPKAVQTVVKRGYRLALDPAEYDRLLEASR